MDKIEKKQRTKSINFDLEDFSNCPVDKICQDLKSAEKQLENDGFKGIRFYFMEYYAGGYECNVWGSRPETDEEYQQRIDSEKRSKLV